MALYTIGVFDDAIEAHIAKGRLSAEGIPAYIADEHYIWANWSMSLAIGGVKLQARKSDISKAKDVLNQLESGNFSELIEDESATEKCIHCGSVNLKKYNPWHVKIAQLATVLIWTVAVRVRDNKSKCLDCGMKQSS